MKDVSVTDGKGLGMTAGVTARRKAKARRSWARIENDGQVYNLGGCAVNSFVLMLYYEAFNTSSGVATKALGRAMPRGPQAMEVLSLNPYQKSRLN